MDMIMITKKFHNSCVLQSGERRLVWRHPLPGKSDIKAYRLTVHPATSFK